MKRLVSGAEGRALDTATNKLFSLDAGVLIEKASLRLWDSLRAEILMSRSSRTTRIVAVCGKGGNGDDGLALLRHAFSAGWGNLVAIVASEKGTEGSSGTRSQVVSLGSAGITIYPWAELGTNGAEAILAEADLVLDAVLGTGTSGALRGEAAEMIGVLSSLSKHSPRPLIVTIDLPSGIRDGWVEGETCVKADLCLSLEPLKLSQFLPEARTSCGRILPVPDVFPLSLLSAEADACLLEEADLAILQPPFDPAAYKSRRGRLAIFAGARGTAGAARLCAKAAAASGAGYLTLYVDEEILSVMARDLESCVVKPLEAWKGEAAAFDAVLAGPGWGRGEGRKAILELLAGLGVPLVLDADALRLAAEEPGILSGSRNAVILTPHPGEFAALAEALGRGEAGFSPEILEAVGRKYGATIVYKSHVTWIRGPSGKLAVWDGMEPGLGTAGSGDVLAGLAAGLVAGFSAASGQTGRGSPALASSLQDAAAAAVIAHGMAGRALAREKGWFEASDLPQACAKLLHDSRAKAFRQA